ncbi:hypothetical protein BV898_04983 [Hypsibius exemplaris]|uniref:Uncharacterized protein n=1 Tax=Hypsibius exemplaris TaxID=2072580 RepID=A0A1W0X0G1_HYPEX|nr:hypothetical protein BV898_04983 [Hypsibius exemplaris]
MMRKVCCLFVVFLTFIVALAAGQTGSDGIGRAERGRNSNYYQDEKRDKFADEAPWYLGKRNGRIGRAGWVFQQNRHDWTIGKRNDDAEVPISVVPYELSDPRPPRSYTLRYGR